MRLDEIFDPDEEHFDALRDTGFFGKMGAGCIFLAADTGRLLLAHRSVAVEQPHSWGGWGGAVNSGETPIQAVKREVYEETGHSDYYDLDALYVFKSGTFQYHNFLVTVQKEFEPRLDWENQGYEWCEWGDWPQPLHFGLISLFNDERSVRIITSKLRGR